MAPNLLLINVMAEHSPVGKKFALDPEPLALGRRATYRRILAVLKAQGSPFVVTGAVGLSLQVGRLIDGELEVYMRSRDVPDALTVIKATGLKVEADDQKGRARIFHGDHRVTVRWALPSPLFGSIDDAWFRHARRTHFLGVRVKAAPIEELLWLKIAAPGPASVGDVLIPQLLLERGEDLDWNRLLVRLRGLEALVLAHIFLFWHQYPESARVIVPEWVVEKLRQGVYMDGPDLRGGVSTDKLS
jgi:hypothetical protein